MSVVEVQPVSYGEMPEIAAKRAKPACVGAVTGLTIGESRGDFDELDLGLQTPRG